MNPHALYVLVPGGFVLSMVVGFVLQPWLMRRPKPKAVEPKVIYKTKTVYRDPEPALYESSYILNKDDWSSAWSERHGYYPLADRLDWRWQVESSYKRGVWGLHW
jgi:hypothetical protein